MRITNNMMLRNSANNITGNKWNVNDMNNQMSSQKKIQRPSDDPVIAIRALRLRSTLSEINQYYENNIPDAEAWLEVTETALKNMETLLDTIRTQCTYGANDPLTAEDRDTILTQLTKLRDQIYSEGNTDYAGRTIFTGYRTNHKLTFMEDDPDARYEITQRLSFADIEEHRYYSDKVSMPNTYDELSNPISDPKRATYDRIRLSYGEIESITGLDASGQPVTATNNKDEVRLSYSYTGGDGSIQTDGRLNVTVYETIDEWMADKNPIPPGEEAVFIKETGELILGEDASSKLRNGRAQFELDYTKTGFDKGELRPEYYHNCTDVTEPGNPIEYVKYDEDGNEIYQDINYIVSANQKLTVNTTASDVFDASIARDVDEMIEAIRFAIDANDKVAKLEEMQKMAEYASDDAQAKLEEWIVAAKKEADYANDNVQKLYNSYIGNCDKYLSNVNLALTDVGSKGDSLDVTKNRMENQQSTVESLKSDNEDRDISDIIIDYTAAYNAYQASLQAAAKINQNTLLNYI